MAENRNINNIKKNEFDKSKLSKNFPLLALRVPSLDIKNAINILKGYCWEKSKFVLPDGPNTKIIVLNQNIINEDLREISSENRTALNSIKGYEIIKYDLKIGYDEMTSDEIFKELFPGIEIVSCFETIGHIAHLNLNEESLPYKYIIGQVILEKNKHIKTVVNKVGEIDNSFRTFKMELLAGIDDMNTEVKESGCKYRFNFSEVYWNSRLGTEHKRIVELFQPGQIIVDMFAGVGPFAIPAAKRGCIVYANDLNPTSYHYLQLNAKLNKCQIFAYNMDGRDFIRSLLNAPGPNNNNPLRIDHIIMNLPASAIDFLDVFINLYEEGGGIHLPTIHCYTFSKAEDLEKDTISQAERILKRSLDESRATVSKVRLVSTKKWMTRLSFRLPPSLSRPLQEEPQLKKRKIEQDEEKPQNN